MLKKVVVQPPQVAAETCGEEKQTPLLFLIMKLY